MQNFPFTTNNLIEATVIIILFILAGKALTWFVQKHLTVWTKRSKTQFDDLVVEKVRPPFSYVVWFIGIKVALRPLNLDYPILDKILNTVVLVVIIYMIAVVVDIILKGIVARIASKTESTLDDALLPLISKTISVIIIIIGLMWALSIWEVDISPLLASLGIAGLAIGLAVKDSLANIFGGVSMILDQTIKVGDKIKLESGESGYVHDMGLRSTKLRTFDNEIITIPNGQLANSRIQNFVQPSLSQRVVVDFSVGYSSNVDKVRKVVRDVLVNIEGLEKGENPPEVLFLSMEDFYLKFSARFWVPDAGDAWNKRIEAVDKIFITLKESNIDIPFPTQKILLEK